MNEVTKPGYKHTELGWIPVEWEVKELKQLGPFKKGKGIRKDQVSIDGFGCVRYGELYTHYKSVISETRSFINPELVSQTQRIEYGDILFAGSGETKAEIGKCAAFIGTKETYAGGDIVILSPKKDNPRFLGYLLNQTEIAKQKAQFGQGDAVVHIYPNGLGKVKIPLPPLSEQTAIATALSDIDGYIGSLEKLIDKKRMIKQGAMQELLTPKEDWEVRKLGDSLISNPSYGINAAACDYSDILPAYLRITDISEQGEYLSDYKVSVNHPLSQDYFLEIGDLVVARTGASVGKTYLYNVEDGRLVYAGFLIRLRPSPKILNPFFLKYITQTREYWNWISVMSMRSGQPGINGQEIKSYEIFLPDISRQNEISELLFSMDNEIIYLQKKLQKVRQLKQGMMQELLTGKVRLV